MNTDEWVDLDTSNELPNLRAQGEGQTLEFKRQFPQQVSDLAKEIAAFATSNDGQILVGVDDNGDLVGMGNMDDAAEREKITQRVEGICANSIKPALTPEIAWAKENNMVVLVLKVSKGSEPIYYAGNIPYVRHITASKPADPSEVIQAVRVWLGSSSPQAATQAPAGRSGQPVNTFTSNYNVRGISISKEARELARIASNIEAILSNGSVKQLQSHVANIGQRLVGVSKDPALSNAELEGEIWRLGMELYGLQNRRMYIDGGKSLNQLVADIQAYSAEISALSAQIESEGS